VPDEANVFHFSLQATTPLPVNGRTETPQFLSQPMDHDEPAFGFHAPLQAADGDPSTRLPLTGLPPPASASWFSLQNARRFFDLSTREVIVHLTAAATPARRDFFDLLHKPDLYGALWVPASVAFLAFALGNLTSWLRATHDFQYNFRSLVSAFAWQIVFVLAGPFLFKYWGTEHGVVNLMTLFGYSTVYIVPPAVCCVFLGKTFGFVGVFAGAVVGAYSVSRKTGGREPQALPWALGRGDSRAMPVNRMGLLYFALHIIVHIVCFL
jgi:hypothetical protein